MTLLVDLVVIAGGVLIGRWVARSIRADRRGSAEPPPAPPADPLAHFPCKLGDVVLRHAEHDEAWLAGALLFEEDAPVAALFVAPEAGSDRAIFARASGGTGGILWMVPLPAGTITRTSEPPHVLELTGTRFERTRRLPVHVSRLGAGAPDIGDQAVVLEYAAEASERVIVVAGTSQFLCWRGTLLGEGEYEVLPGPPEPS